MALSELEKKLIDEYRRVDKEAIPAAKKAGVSDENLNSFRSVTARALRDLKAKDSVEMEKSLVDLKAIVWGAPLRKRSGTALK